MIIKYNINLFKYIFFILVSITFSLPANSDLSSEELIKGRKAIFSKNYRAYLIDKIEKNNFEGHIDTDYLSNKVISYKIPLIIQLWSETENSKNWGNLGRIPVLIIGADKNKKSWEIIYFVNKNIHLIIVILITLLMVTATRRVLNVF